MSSKREEERSEKIIRGLMKLPPNRRCINCNSLGPQYVCTDFWTFVCTICSGIHREFTHRVKSVSMAKFTSQEVDTLQKGGNQRARELYLSTWDPERNRLPNNSNIDKVRQFIKNVYVDKLYTVEKSSDRPPRDTQSLRSDEDQTRRASSYHSYSQSPPYDFQYEERRYGKRAPTLTKPGSDRGLYDGNLASFLSPARLSARANDDDFSNEVFFPRVSDYSVSGGNPYSETSRDISNEASQHPTVHNADAINRSNAGRTLHPQLWSAFEDSSRVQPNEEVLQSGGLAAVHGVSYANKSASKTHSHVKSAEMSEPPSSGLSSNFSLDTNDFPIILASAGVYSSTNGHKPTNPFDLPYDAGVESCSMFWDMSSLQAALPNAQMPTSYVGGVDHSRFPQSSIPSFVPGSLGFVAGQAPSNQIQNIHAQGPVASVGGNPFA